MSTRSNIYLKLKDESKGQTIKFDFDKLPREHGEQHAELEFPIKDVTIPQNAEYIGIYHHWDGYPEGVGVTLVKKFNDYDTILNLLLGGNASSINGDVIRQYCAWDGEDWKLEQPNQLDYDECICSEKYIYKFENGKWYFKAYAYKDEEWKDLREYLEIVKEL